MQADTPDRIKELVKKYSDYVRYPIKTWVTKYEHKDNDEESESHQEHKFAGTPLLP